MGIRIQNIGLLTPFSVNTKLLGERIATSGYRPPRNDRFFDRLDNAPVIRPGHFCVNTGGDVGIDLY